ncbi:hypothetical protein F3J44_19405 [Pantoea sp. Tr-811]|nr:hypothetical protein [Pantoea sp. Tr-811]
MQPIRGASPLLQGFREACRSGLAPRMGRNAAPAISDQTTPWANMASATFTKPAMFAPFT